MILFIIHYIFCAICLLVNIYYAYIKVLTKTFFIKENGKHEEPSIMMTNPLYLPRNP